MDDFLKNPQYASLRTGIVVVVFSFLGIFIFTQGINHTRDDYSANVYKNADVISTEKEEHIQALSIDTNPATKGCFVRFENGKVSFFNSCPVRAVQSVALSESIQKFAPENSVVGYNWNPIPKVVVKFSAVSVKSIVPQGCFITFAPTEKNTPPQFANPCPVDFNMVNLNKK